MRKGWEISYFAFPADFCQPPVALLNVLCSLKPNPVSISHLRVEVIYTAIAFSSQTGWGTFIASIVFCCETLHIILKFSKITIVSFFVRGKTVTIWANNTVTSISRIVKFFLQTTNLSAEIL